MKTNRKQLSLASLIVLLMLLESCTSMRASIIETPIQNPTFITTDEIDNIITKIPNLNPPYGLTIMKYYNGREEQEYIDLFRNELISYVQYWTDDKLHMRGGIIMFIFKNRLDASLGFGELSGRKSVFDEGEEVIAEDSKRLARYEGEIIYYRHCEMVIKVYQYISREVDELELYAKSIDNAMKYYICRN